MPSGAQARSALRSVMHPLEWLRPPMIQDDAGRSVRRFAPWRQSFFPHRRSADPGVREIADRLNEHMGSSYRGLADLLVFGIVGGPLVGCLAAGAYTAVLYALLGSRGLTRWGDYTIYVGIAFGFVGLIIMLVLRELRRDRDNTPTITRTLREEGRCLSCATLIEAPPDALHACAACNARWKHAATPAQLQSTPPSDEWPTIADVTGRVFRVVDIQQVRERPEIERLVGVIQDKSRVGRSAWLVFNWFCAILFVSFNAKWFLSLHGIWRWTIGLYLIWISGIMAVTMWRRGREPPKLLTNTPVPGTLLRHEYCPACLATLRLGTDPRETRHCPECKGVWPGASEMTAHGFPAMTPGTCQVCRYDVSRCAADAERLVVCPECGAQSRLAPSNRK